MPHEVWGVERRLTFCMLDHLPCVLEGRSVIPIGSITDGQSLIPVLAIVTPEGLFPSYLVHLLMYTVDGLDLVLDC